MAGNRKQGFLRGNASGRNGSGKTNKWFCAGCKKEHLGKTERTLMAGLDYCNRQYLAFKKAQFEARQIERVQLKLF